MVEGACTGCHQTSEIMRSSGYTREGWKELTSTMIDLSASPAERDQIIEYLATHFPPNDKRAPKADARRGADHLQGMAGADARPALARPGRGGRTARIWWAGQWANLIGRIDPATGEMKEYPLPPNAMPHTVVLDDAGNVWYTGNKNGTVGKLDPKTGEVTDYKMPDPAAKDPHTAVFDRKGILWFTLQHQQHGRPAGPGHRRHQARHDENAGRAPLRHQDRRRGLSLGRLQRRNCLVKVDPATMELTEVKLPTPGDHGPPSRHRR